MLAVTSSSSSSSSRPLLGAALLFALPDELVVEAPSLMPDTADAVIPVVAVRPLAVVVAGDAPLLPAFDPNDDGGGGGGDRSGSAGWRRPRKGCARSCDAVGRS